MHVHARKGNAECKYWIDINAYDIKEALSNGLKVKDKREIR